MITDADLRACIVRALSKPHYERLGVSPHDVATDVIGEMHKASGTEPDDWAECTAPICIDGTKAE